MSAVAASAEGELRERSESISALSGLLAAVQSDRRGDWCGSAVRPRRQDRAAARLL